VKGEHLIGCAKCHLPQLADATDAVAQEIVGTIQEWQASIEENDEAGIDKAKKTLTSLNINCLVCHNRNAVIHKWTDGFPEKDTVYGAQAGEHADPKFPRMAKGPRCRSRSSAASATARARTSSSPTPLSAPRATAATSSPTSPRAATRPARSAT
jgi:hypothetical protein